MGFRTNRTGFSWEEGWRPPGPGSFLRRRGRERPRHPPGHSEAELGPGRDCPAARGPLIYAGVAAFFCGGQDGAYPAFGGLRGAGKRPRAVETDRCGTGPGNVHLGPLECEFHIIFTPRERFFVFRSRHLKTTRSILSGGLRFATPGLPLVDRVDLAS